jgi:hypothetical protein
MRYLPYLVATSCVLAFFQSANAGQQRATSFFKRIDDYARACPTPDPGRCIPLAEYSRLVIASDRALKRCELTRRRKDCDYADTLAIKEFKANAVLFEVKPTSP